MSFLAIDTDISLEDIIKLSEIGFALARQVFAKIKNKADDNVKLAYYYYEKNAHDLTLICLEKAIKTNESNSEICSQLHLLRGDLFTEKGMKLLINKIYYPIYFEKSIEEFEKLINFNPLDSIGWLGKGFAHLMLALQSEEEFKAKYHAYEVISSVEAGLISLEESGVNKERKSNLLALKGAAYYLIGKDEEGDKYIKESGISLNLQNKSS